jgi:hypothetical protein
MDFSLGLLLFKLVKQSALHKTMAGMLTQCARRYMFIDVTKKALMYLALVAVLSILTKLVPLPTDWYISQVRENLISCLQAKANSM